MLSFVITCSVVVVGFIGVKKLNLKWGSQAEEAANTALSRLDHVAGGLRYTGAASRVVLTKKYKLKVIESFVPLDNRYIRFEQLCRTDSDRWFVLAFEVKEGFGVKSTFEVLPISDSKAKEILQDFPEEYGVEFGDPEIA